MFSQLAQISEDYFFLYLLLLVVLGTILGILGSYLISFMIAIYQIMEFMVYIFISSGGA